MEFAQRVINERNKAARHTGNGFSRARLRAIILGTLLFVAIGILWLFAGPEVALLIGLFLVWFVYRLNPRYIALSALIMLPFIPVLLYSGRELEAERLASYAFFLIAITVVLQIARNLRVLPVRVTDVVQSTQGRLEKIAIPSFRNAPNATASMTPKTSRTPVRPVGNAVLRLQQRRSVPARDSVVSLSPQKLSVKDGLTGVRFNNRTKLRT